MRDIDYLQADNEMKTFANMTGGMSFIPRFVGEMPDIFSYINQEIRSKYQLVYQPSNPSRMERIASCAWNWWTTRASRCACRMRSTSR